MAQLDAGAQCPAQCRAPHGSGLGQVDGRRRHVRRLALSLVAAMQNAPSFVQYEVADGAARDPRACQSPGFKGCAAATPDTGKLKSSALHRPDAGWETGSAKGRSNNFRDMSLESRCCFEQLGSPRVRAALGK